MGSLKKECDNLLWHEGLDLAMKLVVTTTSEARTRHIELVIKAILALDEARSKGASSLHQSPAVMTTVALASGKVCASTTSAVRRVPEPRPRERERERERCE